VGRGTASEGTELPGGIRAKIALALVVIVGCAQLAAYLLVVPTLERALVDARLDQLEASARTFAAALATRDVTQSLSLQAFAEVSAAELDARVVVLSAAGSPTTLVRVADSYPSARDAIESSAAARTASRTGSVARSRGEHGGVEMAVVAVPLFPSAGVALLASPLGDELATIKLVERRFLAATLAALAIALVLGSLVAAVHAHRIRRLERAANRIAAGQFDEPIVDAGDDELGQLATAFDRMRVQLLQLDTARKEFVANASHELRTPLFSLAGFLELMDDDEIDAATRREFLATTREQVDRLTRLSADLLDLSRVDAGRLHVESEDVSLREVAAALGDELRPLAEARDHELVIAESGDVWAVADEERVLQVARALAGNALVHTPPGTHVLVTARRIGDRAVLEVEDDGPGIPIEHVERIFDRFYRAEGSVASGSGLGLAIARELALCMDGSVSVQTRPGRTVFTLSLPGESPVAAVPA
jgi:signal transduction histidine kinase